MYSNRLAHIVNFVLQSIFLLRLKENSDVFVMNTLYVNGSIFFYASLGELGASLSLYRI